jgi:hypothetical protein
MAQLQDSNKLKLRNKAGENFVVERLEFAIIVTRDDLVSVSFSLQCTFLNNKYTFLDTKSAFQEYFNFKQIGHAW